jgi:hypothetical protein
VGGRHDEAAGQCPLSRWLPQPVAIADTFTVAAEHCSGREQLTRAGGVGTRPSGRIDAVHCDRCHQVRQTASPGVGH